MERAKRDPSDALKSEAVPKYLRVAQPFNVLYMALFLILALLCVVPAVFVLIISLTAETSIAKIGYSFVPLNWSLASYEFIWNEKEVIGRAFLVSIGVTIAGTFLGLVTNSTLGYVLSRRAFRLRNFYTFFILIPMLFSGGMVASYMINTRVLHLNNTYFALILPLATSSFYIIILRTFFQTTVPDEIVESGKVDGASQLLIFARIVLPISLPALATIGLFLSFMYWNDWITSMLYIDSNNRPMASLQFVLVNMQRQVDYLVQNPTLIDMIDISAIPNESMRFAVVMVIVIPIACVYPFFQRYFVTGLTIGAVKG